MGSIVDRIIFAGSVFITLGGGTSFFYGAYNMVNPDPDRASTPTLSAYFACESDNIAYIGFGLATLCTGVGAALCSGAALRGCPSPLHSDLSSLI